MRKVLYFVCSLCVTGTLLAKDVIDDGVIDKNKTSLKDFDAFTEQMMSLMNVPGVSVTIIKDDEVLLRKGYGLRNVEKLLPVTTNTLFPVGSITKTFTSFLIGQLVDEGLMHWDDPIAEHIPYFRLSDPHTTYNITVRDYLTHVSGYACHDGLWYNETFERKEIVRRLRYLAPITKLRENFLYGQVGYTVVGHAAECTMEKSYEALIKEYILNPLKMKNSVLSIKEMCDSEDYSEGYREHNREVYSVNYLDPYSICPAAGINSNICDLTAWAKLIQKNGQGLIQESTFNEITEAQVIANICSKPKFQVKDLIPIEAYGLGWMMVTYQGQLIVFHAGNIEGFSSIFLHLPESNISMVVLTNKHMTPLPFFLGIFAIEHLLDIPPLDWLDRYHKLSSQYVKDDFAKNSEITRHQNTEPSHPLHDFAGRYFHPAYGYVDINADKTSLHFIFNRLHIPLSHWHYNVFNVPKECGNEVLSGLKLTFNENMHGDIYTVSMLLEPMDKEIVFTKVNTEISTKNPLEEYIGEYSYHGFIFTITFENESLIVQAMGQPPFELTMAKKHQFIVKGYQNYQVQFIPDESGAIASVQLIQPGGAMFTANRR